MSSSARFWGIVCGLLSALSFSTSNFMIRIGASSVPASQIMVYRFGLAMLFLTPFVYREIPILFRKTSGPLWLRFAGGSAALWSLFTNIKITGLAGSTAMNNLSSLFVVSGSALIFREKLSLKEWSGIAVVLIGAILLQSPWGLTIPVQGLFIGTIGALAAGVGLLALKKSSAQASALFMVWGFCLACGLIAFFTPSGNWVSPNQDSFLWLSVLASIGIAGQIFLAKAYALLPASIASTLGLSGLVWSIVLESTYLKRMPSLISCLGYLAILSGLLLLKKKKPGEKAKPKKPVSRAPSFEESHEVSA